MSNLTVTMGGQAGSEGKGAITARLHREKKFDWAVRIGGPNAGHTVVDSAGQHFPLRQIPVAAAVDPDCKLVIAAGSEIDFGVVEEEVALLEDAGHRVRDRLFIDREATVITPGDLEAEKSISTGTTGKGIGGSRASRALRQAARVADLSAYGTDTQEMLCQALRKGEQIMIEGTQGYVLGSHAGYYPYCTSGNCRASDFIAAAGLPPTAADVWIVLRTHPIRIAGNSGPLPGEMSWEELGVKPEITTVTKKVRRVGAWNWEWARKAVLQNSPPENPARVALTFADYWWPDVKATDGLMPREWLDDEMNAWVDEMENTLGVRVGMLGTGADTQIVIEDAVLS